MRGADRHSEIVQTSATGQTRGIGLCLDLIRLGTWGSPNHIVGLGLRLGLGLKPTRILRSVDPQPRYQEHA